jgi:hypothetical protein
MKQYIFYQKSSPSPANTQLDSQSSKPSQTSDISDSEDSQGHSSSKIQ